MEDENADVLELLVLRVSEEEEEEEEEQERRVVAEVMEARGKAMRKWTRAMSRASVQTARTAGLVQPDCHWGRFGRMD